MSEPVAPRRLAVTMWEFSWLVRRSGRQAEYLDWDRVLDELVERGYNCIRLDAFPHLVGRDEVVEPEAVFTILPQNAAFPWGNHEAVRVQPRQGLADFLRRIKARGLRAGLSSWFNDDDSHQRARMAAPADFAGAWLRTLQWLEHNDLLDTVEWVDFCNEFPLPHWMPVAFERIFGADPSKVSEVLGGRWTGDQVARASDYLHGALAPLRRAYPTLRYTASFTSYGAENVPDLNLGEFQLLEPHIWLAQDRDWGAVSGHDAVMARAPGALAVLAERMRTLWPARRDDYLRRLQPLVAAWAERARALGLPLVTSEAWGPVIYDDLSPDGLGGEWDWVKDVCEEGVRLALRHGWRGVCTSNFCQPHFRGMWRDVAWHQRLTRAILSGSGASA